MALCASSMAPSVRAWRSFSVARQRSLHQKLVGQNQHDKQQHRGHGAEQKGPDLLNDFFHAGTDSLRQSVWSQLSGWNIFLYQGRTLKSTQMEPIWRGPVTAVTKREFYPKKNLLSPENKPRLRIPPRPGPGSSGQPVSGSPSTPAVGCPPLSFQPLFRPVTWALRLGPGSLLVHASKAPGRAARSPAGWATDPEPDRPFPNRSHASRE